MTNILDKIIKNKNCRSILCLNGELPEKKFFEQSIPIIAADGAANQLYSMNITPAIVIGDLDSINYLSLKKFNHIKKLEQDSNDFQKCLKYMQDNNLLPTIITGASGGFIDHILNNFSIFSKTNSLIYAPPIVSFIINKNTNLQLDINTKISLMGFPTAALSSYGLKWELKNQTLDFFSYNSCFNRCKNTNIEIEIHDGSLLIMLYIESVHDAGNQVLIGNTKNPQIPP